MISLKAGVGAWPLRLAKRQRGGERNGAAMAPAFKLALLAGRVDEFKRPERSASFGVSAGVLGSAFGTSRLSLSVFGQLDGCG